MYVRSVLRDRVWGAVAVTILVGIAVVVVATVVLANFVATVPASAAERTHPATVLRSE